MARQACLTRENLRRGYLCEREAEDNCTLHLNYGLLYVTSQLWHIVLLHLNYGICYELVYAREDNRPHVLLMVVLIRRNGGTPSQHVFGGQSGRKRTPVVL